MKIKFKNIKFGGCKALIIYLAMACCVLWSIFNYCNEHYKPKKATYEVSKQEDADIYTHKAKKIKPNTIYETGNGFVNGYLYLASGSITDVDDIKTISDIYSYSISSPVSMFYFYNDIVVWIVVAIILFIIIKALEYIRSTL